MKYKITAVRDLASVLKDLEPQIRDPRHLRVGRDYKQMALRPRELLGNWLLCVVLRHITGRNWTFSDDPTGGDGAMLDRDAGTGFLMEHVFVPPPTDGAGVPVEEAIVRAVLAKAEKGPEYARDRTLLVFSEACGRWFPNRIAKAIAGVHAFDAVWAAGLEDAADGVYRYWVTHFEESSSPAWRIKIAPNFDGWTVEQLQ